jgi:hypothetical protein
MSIRTIHRLLLERNDATILLVFFVTSASTLYQRDHGPQCQIIFSSSRVVAPVHPRGPLAPKTWSQANDTT